MEPQDDVGRTDAAGEFPGIGFDSTGAVVTESSVWLFDGRGGFRRTPREGRNPDAELGYAGWDHLAFAEFVETSLSETRLRVLPLGRPPGSFGLLSGPVLWSSFVVDPLYPERLAGPAQAWFPESPVPGDRDLWPGELPFTAFGQFGPDRLDLRVFDQDVYWVDRAGDPHVIASMGHDYAGNVARMLLDRADEFHLAYRLRESVQVLGDSLLGRVNGTVLAAATGVGSVAAVDAVSWLRSTPLMRRLLAV